MPNDLVPPGSKETFTITVVYDTIELYGKVEASQEVVIAAE